MHAFEKADSYDTNNKGIEVPIVLDNEDSNLTEMERG